MIEDNELYSLAPIVSLSIIYWVRDIYTFNRARQPWYAFSPTQLRVLLLYPIWVFFSWTGYLATARANVASTACIEPTKFSCSASRFDTQRSSLSTNISHSP